jgi:hypothetical protein
VSDQTREALVIATFKDRTGFTYDFGDVIKVAYGTARQRQAVNELVHRGFLTFEIARAQAVQPPEEDPPPPPKAPAKKTPAKKTTRTRRKPQS